MAQAAARSDPRREETRHRILRAGMELFTERGPLAVSMGEIADRAGVERITLYRHFRHERGLQDAVALYCMRLRPPPPLEPLSEISGPLDRTRAALDLLYAHWERLAPIVSSILRDAELAPGRVSVRQRDLYVDRVRRLVLGAFPQRVRRQRLLRDAVRHAFDFRTWSSLSKGGFSRRRAVALMTALIESGALDR